MAGISLSGWDHPTLGRRALRRRAIAVTAGALGVLSAACGGPAGAGESTAPRAQPVKVAFGTKFGAGERADWTKQTVDKFNETYGPRLTAEHTVLGNSVQAPELLIMLSTGSGPDVTQTSGSWFSDFADKNALGDITEYVRRDKVDFNRWYLQEEVIKYKGKFYGMPFWQSPGAFFYNLSLFRKHNVKLPTDDWTWDTMLDAARQMTRPGESWGFQTGYGWEKSWLQFIRANNGDYINKEFTRTTTNTPQAIEAVQWVVDLVLRHRVMAPQGDTSAGSGNLWNQGKVGIMIGGAGTVGSTITAKVDFDWDLCLTPKHPKTGKRVVTANDNPMVVMASSKAREGAWKLTLFTAEKYSQDLVGKYRINMPVLKTSAADPQGWLAPPPASMRYMNEYMKHATFLSFHKNWQQWYNETQKEILPAFKGELSVKDALDKAAQVGDSLLRGV